MPTALIAAATTIMIVVLSTFDTYARKFAALWDASPGGYEGMVAL
jgi:hypothetical protein